MKIMCDGNRETIGGLPRLPLHIHTFTARTVNDAFASAFGPSKHVELTSRDSESEQLVSSVGFDRKQKCHELEWLRAP